MRLTEIAVEGAPATANFRVELACHNCERDGKFQLVQLHDDATIGTCARVFRARAGQCEISMPLAVKIQRDQALNGERFGSVERRFDLERRIHRRLQESPEASEVGIVRQFEIFQNTTTDYCDVLPPCIVCSRARHGLAPRCPADGTILLDAWTGSDADRSLWCEKCGKSYAYTDATKRQLLAATLRHDSACAGCAHQTDQKLDNCHKFATFLNFFPSRILIFELLDLDLGDYLRWAQTGRAPANRDWFMPGRLANALFGGPWTEEYANLKPLVGIFEQILAATEQLHDAGISHRDLKPGNICMRVRGAEVQVKIIDLGYASDLQVTGMSGESQELLEFTHAYAAPETKKPILTVWADEVSVEANGWCEMSLRLDTQLEHWDRIVPGDAVVIRDERLQHMAFRVESVAAMERGSVVVRARPHAGEVYMGSAIQRTEPVEVDLRCQLDFACDIYSLGMLLAAMLLRQENVSAFAQNLGTIERELAHVLPWLDALPGRALVRYLVGQKSDHLRNFYESVQALSSYAMQRTLAEELLGIALKAAIRGDTRVYYLADRGGNAALAMQRLRYDFDRVKRALDRAILNNSAEDLRLERIAATVHLMRKSADFGIGGLKIAGALPEEEIMTAIDLSAGDESECEVQLLVSAADEHRTVQRQLARTYLALRWPGASLELNTPVGDFLEFSLPLWAGPDASSKPRRDCGFEMCVRLKQIWDEILRLAEHCEIQLRKPSLWHWFVSLMTGSKKRVITFADGDVHLTADDSHWLMRIREHCDAERERFGSIVQNRSSRWRMALGEWSNLPGAESPIARNFQASVQDRWEKCIHAHNQWKLEWQELSILVERHCREVCELLVQPLIEARSVQISLEDVAKIRESWEKIRDFVAFPPSPVADMDARVARFGN